MNAMNKAKYILLIILSTLLYIAWLVGLYFSLGLFTHSTELNLPVYAASLVCAVGAWLIDKKINAQDSFKYKPSVPIGSCVFLSLFSLALVYALPHI